MTPEEALERWNLCPQDFSLFTQADSMPREPPPYETGIIYRSDGFIAPRGFTPGPTILICADGRKWYEWRKPAA